MSLADEQSGDQTVSCEHCGHEVGSNGSVGAERPVFDAEPEDQAFAIVMQATLANKIHVNCGSCGRGLKVSLRMAGKKTTCPACGERVKLPLAGQEADRRLEKLIAERSAEFLVSETEAPTAGGPATMQFDKSELAKLATYVETDGADDDLTLDIPEDDDRMHSSADAMEGRDILALSAAVSASSHRPTSAAEELPALQQVVKHHPRQVRTGMSGQKKAVLATVAAGILVGVGIWAAVSFLGSGKTDPDNNGASALLDPGPDDVKTPKVKTPKVKTPPPPPPKVLATCQAVTSSTDFFAGDGFSPAGPGQVYCRICVQVKAGDDKLELDNHGKAAVLTIGSVSYESLGEPVVKPILPTLPRKKHLIISAGETETITMLFKLPQKAVGTTEVKGVVSIGTVRPAPVKLGSPAHVLPAKAIADSSKPYVEIAPRNTRPLLSDPVMSAIQNTTPQKLLIRPGKAAGSVTLSLGSGEVTGTASQDARGLYVTKLSHNGSTLQCLLRFAYGGKEAILYLSEEPFHQLTFAQPGPPKNVPPMIPQQPKVVEPDPKKPEPRRDNIFDLPPKRPRGRGFFGV